MPGDELSTDDSRSSSAKLLADGDGAVVVGADPMEPMMSASVISVAGLLIRLELASVMNDWEELGSIVVGILLTKITGG